MPDQRAAFIIRARSMGHSIRAIRIILMLIAAFTLMDCGPPHGDSHQLAEEFADQNEDLLADPLPIAEQIYPEKLVFAYEPADNPAVMNSPFWVWFPGNMTRRRWPIRFSSA